MINGRHWNPWIFRERVSNACVPFCVCLCGTHDRKIVGMWKASLLAKKGVEEKHLRDFPPRSNVPNHDPSLPYGTQDRLRSRDPPPSTRQSRPWELLHVSIETEEFLSMCSHFGIARSLLRSSSERAHSNESDQSQKMSWSPVPYVVGRLENFKTCRDRGKFYPLSRDKRTTADRLLEQRKIRAFPSSINTFSHERV